MDVCSELLVVKMIMALVATNRHLTLVLNTVITPADTSEVDFYTCIPAEQGARL